VWSTGPVVGKMLKLADALIEYLAVTGGRDAIHTNPKMDKPQKLSTYGFNTRNFIAILPFI
jgi:hypothetical protein